MTRAKVVATIAIIRDITISAVAAGSDALVAQLDRASDYGSEGWGFESLRARKIPGQRAVIWATPAGIGENPTIPVWASSPPPLGA